MKARSVLMVVTSADHMSDGRPTGLWLEEFAVPYLMFLKAGFSVTVASPKGGPAPVDERSLSEEPRVEAWAQAVVALESTRVLSALETGEFDAVFLPGGHGTMFDLAGDPALKALLGRFWAEGKVIASVCHGPAGLVGAKKADGTALVAGKTLTAFTDAEERAIALDQAMPFLLETRLREEGARFIAGEMWAEHIQVDGNLVTGQNPASSAKTAEAVIGLLSQG